MLERGLAGLLVVAFLLLSMVARSRRPGLPVWSLMAFASFLTILLGLVSVDELPSIIDVDVILFLVGMFSIVGLAESSGLLNLMAAWFMSRFKTRYSLLVASSLLFGLLAAVSMNDTVAFMGPPLALVIARAAGVDPKALFLLLAFSLTVGSAMTPVGNPQNILVVEGSCMTAPFVKFAYMLAVPTLANLLVTPLLIVRVFKVENGKCEVLLIPSEAIKNRRDALLGAIGLAAAISALVVNDLLQLAGLPHVSRRGIVPFLIAAGLYMFSSNPRRLLGNVDWGTIVFFISMFVTMEGVWRSGVFNPLLSALLPSRLEGAAGVLAITAASLLMSQVISNVPFARFFVLYMKSLGYTSGDDLYWVTLAASSTIAGNLTPLGAASNIIVMEYLESRMNTTILLKDFVKVGFLVTAVNTSIYLLWLLLLSAA